MNIVDCLLGFYYEENASLLMDVNEYDITSLRVIATELLSWMKLQQKRMLWINSGKKTSLKPMTLNMSYQWCQLLCQYVETQSKFNEAFEIRDGYLDFRKDLAEEYILYAFQVAYEKYNPQIIVG